jgi:hypothetical protein
VTRFIFIAVDPRQHAESEMSLTARILSTA